MLRKHRALGEAKERGFSPDDFCVNKLDVFHTEFLISGPEGYHLMDIYKNGTTRARGFRREPQP
eukprot:4843431-Prorocentrum_lima.AAC.1